MIDSSSQASAQQQRSEDEHGEAVSYSRTRRPEHVTELANLGGEQSDDEQKLMMTQTHVGQRDMQAALDLRQRERTTIVVVDRGHQQRPP